MRLIDADKLKNHYSWWAEMYQEEKEVFDTIIDQQSTVDLHCPLCGSYLVEEKDG